MDYAHMADFWHALFDGNLLDAKQEIQTRIEKLTANYRTRVIPTHKTTRQTIRETIK